MGSAVLWVLYLWGEHQQQFIFEQFVVIGLFWWWRRRWGNINL
jgi:hypothetical protein